MGNKSRLAVVLVLLLLAAAKAAASEDLFKRFGVSRPKVKVEAPAFSLKSLDGRVTNLKELKGKVVVLNFWASWCKPCRREMPSLSHLSERFHEKGLIVLTVTGERGFFGSRNVKKFVTKQALNLPVLLDSGGKARKTYEVSSLPTTYIIGRDGRITGKILGERLWDGKVAQKFFLRLLGP